MLGNQTESIALLLHRAAWSNTVEVTSHRVMQLPEKGFALGAGRLFSQQDKDLVADILTGQKSTLSFIPDNVLARDSSGLSMVWFTPPRMATVRFRENEYSVPMPTLVYVKTEGKPLRVFAAKGRARPSESTSLWTAPLGNINRNGTMCSGNVQLGSFRGTDSDRAACEAFAVEARATHLGDTNPVKGVDNHADFEAYIAKLEASKVKSFPSTSLLPAQYQGGPLTLRDLLEVEVAQ